jgi:hypothetical protein
VYALDVVVNGLFGGLLGVVAGWMLGRGRTSTAAN